MGTATEYSSSPSNIDPGFLALERYSQIPMSYERLERLGPHLVDLVEYDEAMNAIVVQLELCYNHVRHNQSICDDQAVPLNFRNICYRI